MQLDKETIKISQIFHPGQLEAREALKNKQVKFVYYTNAETALKIINNQELWFRNATVMNDYSEISYGLDLIARVFSGNEGERFRFAVDAIFPNTILAVGKLLGAWESDWRLETYLACVSVHEPFEDEIGRLSMWRAYGDTALVVNSNPMAEVTDELGVFSFPVSYFSEDGFRQHLCEITEQISINQSYLQDLGQETLINCIHRMLFRIAIASKHPGFAEEKEWRLYYRPNEQKSQMMSADVCTLGGVPPRVFKLNLAAEAYRDQFETDMPNLLEKLIIGPASFPYMRHQAFTEALTKRGLKDAAKKVVISSIPLRNNQG